MVNSCMLIRGCGDGFLMLTPSCTLDRRRFGFRMIGMLLALSASCIFLLRLYASLPGISGLSFDSTLLSLVLLPSPVTLSVVSFSSCWLFLLNFFQKILQYFLIGDRLFCMAPV